MKHDCSTLDKKNLRHGFDSRQVHFINKFTLMKPIVSSLILSFLLGFSTLWSQIDTQSLGKIYDCIENSVDQDELKLSSIKLFRFWEGQVKETEKKIVKGISKNEAKRFISSMNSWRDHVEKMSKMRSKMFKKDFMTPQYYDSQGVDKRLERITNLKGMEIFVYNMSKAIYYEEKWIELDILLNTN